MSIDLKNLAGAGTASLDDLVSPVNTAEMPINNESTANDMAAHAALLTEPEMAVDNYSNMMREFSTNEGSPSMDKIIYQANKRENELSIGQMTDILGDNEIPLDRKVGYASLWRTGFVEPNRERSPQELVGINQLEKDGAITDDEEVDNTRWDLAGKLSEVNAYNAEIQKMINEADISENPSLFGKVADIAEMILAPSQISESPRVLGVQQGLREELDEGNDANGRATAMIKSFTMLGESKEEIRARIAQVPIGKRAELAQAVYDMVLESNKSLTGKNSLVAMNNLREYLVDGEYTTGDRIVDDISSVLDAVGLGMVARTAKEIIRGPAAAARIMKRNPVSVGETIAQTNTKSANEMIKLAADDTTGEVAKRVYGTSREDAITATVGSEIGQADGSVRLKPLIDDDQFDPDMAAVNQATSSHGSIQFTEAEKASKLQTVTSDFNNFDKTGLVNHKQMTSITAVDGGVNVRTIIGPAEGGFSDPAEAIRQVKYATAKYGVSDEEITLLKLNNEGNYVPVKNAELEYAKDQAAGRVGSAAVPAGHTRFFHGGAGDLGDTSKLNDLWVTPDLKYAKDYRRGDKANNVWYVDIPNDRLAGLGVRDEINGYNINGKLPAEYARKAQPYKEGLPSGSYVVGINHTTPYDPNDTIAWSTTDVKGSFLGVPLNVFDKLPLMSKGKQGSITQHLIPNTAYLDPILTRSASVTADQTAHTTALLLNTANEYATKYKGLNKVGKSKVDNYIIQANHESLKFNPEKLRADGWTENELDALRGWKKTQDTLFVLENTDMVRQAKRKGFGMFTTGDGSDSFLVKPLANNTMSRMDGFKGKAYDPELGLIRTITAEERKTLYKEGGTMAKARYPIPVGEENIGFVIVKQNPSSYIRALRENDQLLKYRDGHFTIYYKDPVFITTVAKNADGSEYEKVLATSGTINEAKEYIGRLQKANPKGKYDFRADRVGDELDEYMWQTRVNAGRTSQRTRGETLKDVTDRPTDPQFRHIMAPEESLIRSISSISRRINYKEWLDVAKERFKNQYKDFLPQDPNTKARIWPDDVTKLRDPGLSGDRKAYSDAISTYRFIDAQENGFINLLDDASKNFFKAMAETAGNRASAPRMVKDKRPRYYRSMSKAESDSFDAGTWAKQENQTWTYTTPDKSVAQRFLDGGYQSTDDAVMREFRIPEGGKTISDKEFKSGEKAWRDAQRKANGPGIYPRADYIKELEAKGIVGVDGEAIAGGKETKFFDATKLDLVRPGEDEIVESGGGGLWSKFEKAARAGEELSPTATARKQVFRLTLAANPLRQIVVQASQAVPVIAASNPTFFVKLPWQMTLTRLLDRGGTTETLIDALGSKLTGLKRAEALELAEAYKKSGISSAVSAHSLIRDDLKSLVNRSVVQKAGAVVGKPLDITQKVGFEAGENMLMRSVWLSEYDKARRLKKAPLNAADLSMLHARVRDLTLNMNKAGELAYNENTLSVILQFAQAPHKGLAQILLGNRALSGADRAKLATSYLIAYGTGYGLMYEAASALLPEDDRELHDLVSGGLFQYALNRTLSTLYGEPVNTDFSSSMRLAEIPNLPKMFEAMATMDLESIMTSSPAVGLVYGDNARLGNLAKSIYRFFTVPEDDGALKDVGYNFLNIYSGLSNFFKARYAMQRGYSTSTKGEVSDPNVNEVEAMMKVMGFQTVDEMLGYATNEKLYKSSGKLREDVKYLLDETARRMGREGISEKESEYVIRLYQEANRVFKNNPAYMEVVAQEIGRRAKTGDHIILNRLIQNIPIWNESEFQDALSKAPIEPDKKRELRKIFDFMKEPE